MASYQKRKTKSKGMVWDVVFRVNDGEDMVQKRLSGYPTKRDAQRAYEEYVSSRAPKTRNIVKVSFSEAYNSYIESRQNILSYSGSQSIKYAFKLHILPYFDSKNLGQITHADIVHWREDLWNQKKDTGELFSQRSCEQVFASFKCFMKWSVEAYSLLENPFDGLKPLVRREQKKEKKTWTEDDFRRFIAEIKKENYKVFFSVLYYSGCRKNEINALTAEDFVKTNDHYVIKISKSVTYMVGKGRTITPPKTSSSNRTINLPECLTSMLDNFLDGQTGYLWMLPSKTIEYQFLSNSQKANLPGICIHDLRHSHISFLISGGIPVTEVSKRAGHSNSGTTLNVYSHALDSNEQDVLKVLDNMWDIVSSAFD